MHAVVVDRLESLEAFVRVVEEGGFAPAARALRRSPAMIAKHIAALERSAGTRLFHRTTRTVTLTDAGQHFLSHAQTIVAEFATALNEAHSKQGQPSGWLKVTLPAALVNVLGASIASFLFRVPAVAA
jgi:DNA-binding transcriptional LysR family regulator